jgi:hypothetical protein
LLVKAFVGAKLFTLDSERIAEVKVVKTRIRCILFSVVKGGGNCPYMNLLHHPFVANWHSHAIRGVVIHHFTEGMLEGWFKIRSRPRGTAGNV